MNLLDWIASLLARYNSRFRNHLTSVENFQNFAKFKTPSRFTRLSIIKTSNNPLILAISDYKNTLSLFSSSTSSKIFLFHKFKYKTLNFKYNFISNIITYQNFKGQTFQKKIHLWSDLRRSYPKNTLLFDYSIFPSLNPNL